MMPELQEVIDEAHLVSQHPPHDQIGVCTACCMGTDLARALLILSSVERNDSPVLVGGILLVVTVFLFVNLAVDVLYGVIDPRVRESAE